MDTLFQPWAWYVSGPLIAFSMYLMFYFGKRLGISSNLETFCAIAGVGKLNSFFKFDWKKNLWNLSFIIGLIIGGFIAKNYLSTNNKIDLNPKTKIELQHLGFKNPGANMVPNELFSFKSMNSKSIFILVIAGFLVGFGARYAGGCTSGHAIVGLSMLERPSLIAVIGFFIGGLIMTWVLYPIIFS